MHDWYGLLPHVRTRCDELAVAGLVAVAPDLYDGRTASDPEQAEALMEAMDSARARAKLDAAIAALRERTVGGPVGGLGFSMGGFRVLLQATTGPSTRSPSTTPPWTRSRRVASTAPSCSTSPSATSSTLRRCSSSSWPPLRAAGTPVEARTRPGTEHAFANADVPLYVPTQAAEAWSTTVRFLREHLGSP